MTDSDRRCVPPCERILSDFDKHEFCFECLGVDHAAQGLEGECELCDVFEFRVLRVRLAFFKRDRSTSSSPCGSRFVFTEARETDTSASLVHSPNRGVLASASEACPGTSSEPAEDEVSLVSAGLDSSASGRSSRDIKAVEDLLGAVTKAVDRLKLDWPREQEAPKSSKLNDRYLPDGWRDEPQNQALSFFEDLHGELSRSWQKPHSSRVFVPSTLIYSTIVGAGTRGYTAMPRVEETLASYLSPGTSSSLEKPSLPT
ncbi:uncharacterized protein LOC130435844 [Triplophysa dalaica]|uniref:uncharacterized protein LOC130435844 n=1 Tax=Triplophysa dalaica TaxID=1582913 RepID=UPI0024DF8AB1|nr:uncharacterized protein LOC130435844 [Triplophysa dalaica]